MASMRVSDEDYSRDERGFHLALRMLRHGARLNTICAWTRFTEERVRNLSRSYHRRNAPRRGSDGRRGPSPKKLAPLVATGSLRSESAALAGLCRVLDIIPAARLPNARKRMPGVALGERLCETYELFHEAVPFARTTFEQMIFLVFAVAEGELCSLAHCTNCRAVILIDHLSLSRHLCTHCENAQRDAKTEPAPGGGGGSTEQSPLESAGPQGRLFE